MTNNQSTLQINFKKLENIPYIKKFDQHLFRQEVNDAIIDWQPYLNHMEMVSFVRAMECTNGCIQYALRDQEPYALTLEQSRECMNTSMGFIIHKTITVPTTGEVITIPEELHPQLRKVRELYIDGFKMRQPVALRQFYANSVAQFNLMGEDLIDHATAWLAQNFVPPFTELFVVYGQNYMKQFLQVIE